MRALPVLAGSMIMEREGHTMPAIVPYPRKSTPRNAFANEKLTDHTTACIATRGEDQDLPLPEPR